MFQHLKCTSVLIVGFLVAAVYVIKIVELLSIDYTEISNITLKQNEKSSRDGFGKLSESGLGNSNQHLMWFIQISDLHISSFMDPTRIENLKEFCKEVVPAIQPKVVLASGDLTDGRTADKFGSQQFEEEWRIYKEILLSSGISRTTKWLDIRGNHDNFGVPSLHSSNNYYRRYSVQGVDHPRSYLYQLVDGYDKYSFIAVDACLDPGPKRPFNFYGLLDAKEMRALYDYEDVARKSSNATIWFGHYPTSSILSPSPGIRHLMRNGVAYLCGHFHTLGGWIPHMYTLQKTGFLELELADWKDNRMFRIGAMDHGLFSFVDVGHKEWPVILITNPKPAQFLIPGHEPDDRMTQSTHIRILVFSPSPITKVSVRLNEGEWTDCKHSNGPLYTAAWKPQQYSTGLHTITVTAQDSASRTKTTSHSFSLDGSRISFDFLAKIILMSNLNVASQVVLGLSVCIAVLPLCWIRVMHHYVKVGKVARPRYNIACTYSVMRKLWLVATVDRIFYPLVFMAVYVILGPWFIGEVIDNHTGICFAWGMFVNGSYLPGGYTIVFAVIRIWTFNIPLVWLLAQCLDNRYQHMGNIKSPPSSFAFYVLRQILMVGFLLFNTFVAYLTIPTYGPMAFLLNPLLTWSLFVAVILWQLTVYVPDKCLRHLLPIFPLRQSSKADELMLDHYRAKDFK
ncbi:hypothetical protein CHUAL_005428 [Chamberlinius hualienensis]